LRRNHRTTASHARRLAIVFIVLWGVVLAGGGALAAWTQGEPEAVVLAKEAEVKSGPGPGFATAFVLHEGAEVVVEGERGEWIEVSLPGNLQGWIDGRLVAKL
jgi:uncharacterized protein YraI